MWFLILLALIAIVAFLAFFAFMIVFMGNAGQILLWRRVAGFVVFCLCCLGSLGIIVYKVVT